MNKVLFIVCDDLRQVRSSVMVRIFMVLLIAVSLFFIWFDALVTWDPFSDSERLQIAVASTDEGYINKLLNVEINVGDTVLKELAASDQFSWVLTSKDRVLEGTRSGEYCAVIVSSGGPSQFMSTFYTGGTASADIALYINGKKNSLSTNLTTQGAQGVTVQINTTFSRILVGAAVGIVEDVPSYLGTADTQVALDRLGNHLEFLYVQLNSGMNTANPLSTVIGSAVPLVTGAKQLTAEVQGSFGEAVVFYIHL